MSGPISAFNDLGGGSLGGTSAGWVAGRSGLVCVSRRWWAMSSRLRPAAFGQARVRAKPKPGHPAVKKSGVLAPARELSHREQEDADEGTEIADPG